MRFSQEKVADLSGLSLRTVQRLEAGHRVSYASLRALAVAFKTDADILEREFYAVSKSADEFVEIPRWIRLASDRLWFGGPRLSRRDALGIELLPANLLDAVRELERNDVLRRALGTTPDGDYVDYYAKVKRREWQAAHEQITQWELERYLQLF